MKHKRVLVIILCIPLLVMMLGYIWWHLPARFLTGISPADVARIEVFNGTNGEKFLIEDRADIEHIVTGIADVKMRKAEYSHVDGFTYSISFYAADGTRIDGFILNGDTIRDGAIRYETVYKTDEDPLCFEYIKAIEAAQ